MCAKLIIQIPCFNEENTLPVTFNALPKSVRGMDVVETMIINDGSADNTVDVARNLGVNHIIDLKQNRGLAYVFGVGILEAAKKGADFLVNLDADNQYNADDIPKLLAPLLDDSADIAVGVRPIRRMSQFSPIKKALHMVGTFIFRRLSGIDIKDPPSGFRAMNRKAMISLFTFNKYTYTHETLIAAPDSGLRIVGVPIRVNSDVLRPSRLMKNVFQYVVIIGISVLHCYFIYKPVKFFFTLSALSGIAGAAFAARFLSFYFKCLGGTHVNSLVVFGILMGTSMLFFVSGVLCDIMRINRKLIQKGIVEMREHYYEQ